MKSLKSFVTMMRRSMIKRKLKAVDDLQRVIVDDLLFWSDFRVHAQREYADRSRANAKRKRALLDQLDQLDPDGATNIARLKKIVALKSKELA